MIEAVNATTANASVLRQAVEAVDASRSYASNPERIQQALPQAPYVSPYIAWNQDYNKAVLQIRNGETGDVVRQFPSDSVLANRAKLVSSAETAQVVEPSEKSSYTPEVKVARAEAPQQANVAQAQAAAAALSRGAQAGVPVIATVVTSA